MSHSAEIAARRKRLGISQAALAELASQKAGKKITQQALAKFESRPDARTWHLPALLAALDELEGGKSGKQPVSTPENPNIQPGPEIVGDVPLISWVQAGEFCEAIDHLQLGEDAERFPRMKNHGPRTYCLRVKGDSMTNPVPGQKTYPAGVIIYVDPDAEVLPGKAVIARLPDTSEATLKILVEDAGIAYLKPLNPQYQMQPVPEGTTFCGVVAGSYWPE